MGTVSVKMKVLPASPEVDLEILKQKAKEVVEGKGGTNCHFEEEEIAFGLKALITIFDWTEGNEVEIVEEALAQIENVNSAQLIDMRRAIG
jgi:translation elongation factor aEF-1 beta